MYKCPDAPFSPSAHAQSLISQRLSIYPASPVGVGSSWRTELREMTGSVAVDVVEELTLREHQRAGGGSRGMFRIGLNSTLTPVDAAAPADVGACARALPMRRPHAHRTATRLRSSSPPSDAAFNNDRVHINSIRKLAMHGEQNGASRPACPTHSTEAGALMPHPHSPRDARVRQGRCSRTSIRVSSSLAPSTSG